MPTSIITTEDLQDFKLEMLQELKELLDQLSDPRMKSYLKTSEVMKILKLSSGTLQSLRDSGTLPYVKVGGNIFYEADEIQKMMNRHKVINNFS